MKKHLLAAAILLILLLTLLLDPMAPVNAFFRHGRWHLLLSGFACTLFLTLGALLPGMLLAAGVCRLRLSGNRALRMAGTLWVRLFEGLPTEVMLLLVYYLFFATNGADAATAAVTAFALQFGAEGGEILRHALLAVPKETRLAAEALGFNKRQTLLHVILPQALPRMIPEFGSAVCRLVHETAVVGYITVVDLTRAADIIRGSSCEAFWPLAVLFLVYWALTRLIAAGTRYARWKTDPLLRRDAARKGV